MVTFERTVHEGGCSGEHSTRNPATRAGRVCVVSELAICKLTRKVACATTGIHSAATIVTFERRVHEGGGPRAENSTRTAEGCVVSELAICKLTRHGVDYAATIHNAAPTMVNIERTVHEGGERIVVNGTRAGWVCVVSELTVCELPTQNGT
jgi:hypothetical protein